MAFASDGGGTYVTGAGAPPDVRPRLYVWQPKKFGQSEIHVVETTLEAAIAAVDKDIAEEKKKHRNYAIFAYKGWKEGGYNEPQIFPIGSVYTIDE